MFRVFRDVKAQRNKTTRKKKWVKTETKSFPFIMLFYNLKEKTNLY